MFIRLRGYSPAAAEAKARTQDKNLEAVTKAETT